MGGRWRIGPPLLCPTTNAGARGPVPKRTEVVEKLISVHPSRQFPSRSIPEAELAVSEGVFRTPDFGLRMRRLGPLSLVHYWHLNVNAKDAQARLVLTNVTGAINVGPNALIDGGSTATVACPNLP